ncbi:zinc finger, C2H2-type domain containing protein [Pseudohyphozyma bogoriensis]|nr:zinc finger, C2H2-type domain containing protein [Pseudohyphozyma bogoriensis]
MRECGAVIAAPASPDAPGPSSLPNIPSFLTARRPSLVLPPLPDSPPLPKPRDLFSLSWMSDAHPPLANPAKTSPTSYPLPSLRDWAPAPLTLADHHPLLNQPFGAGSSRDPSPTSYSFPSSYLPSSSKTSSASSVASSRRDSASSRRASVDDRIVDTPPAASTSALPSVLEPTGGDEVDMLEDDNDGAGDGQPRARRRRRRATEAPRDAHLRRHACPTCAKLFARPSALETHLRTHSKEMPFICPEETCARGFAVRSNMRRHQRLRNHKPHINPEPTYTTASGEAEAEAMEEEGEGEPSESDGMSSS